MYKAILVIFLLQFKFILLAQKQSLDTSVLGKWPKVESPAISNDGNYVLYTIANQPTGKNTFVIMCPNSKWKKEFVLEDRGFNRVFTKNNKQVIFQIADTLFILFLKENRIDKIENVRSFKYSDEDEGQWLAYQLDSPRKEVVLYNLSHGETQRIDSVEGYSFNSNGRSLILIEKEGKVLENISLPEVRINTIWSSSNASVSSWCFDDNGYQLIFCVQEKLKQRIRNSIWYYKAGMANAVMKVDNSSNGIGKGMHIYGNPKFSKNGNWILFELEADLEAHEIRPDIVDVDIWSYKDAVIQPNQIVKSEREGSSRFKTVISVVGSKIVRLEHEDEKLQTEADMITGDFAVIQDHLSIDEYWWPHSPQPSFYLISLKDGSRTVLKSKARTLSNFRFSPNGKYLAYWDCDKEGAYYVFDLRTNQIRNISRAIPSKVVTEYPRTTLTSLPVDKIAGWRFDDGTVIIYDNYDLWEIYLMSEKSPINLTNNWGRNNHIKLRLANGNDDFMYSDTDKILLTGFNVLNKYNGFYSVNLNRVDNPELLTMGPWTMYRTESQKPHYVSFDDGMQPLKAKKADVWIIKRQTASTAPNYFLTRDFKVYEALSNLQPQKSYNWLTTELVTWKQLDGTIAQGILYKPENFDPKKKYPLIFNYYEKMSHRLFEFPEPNFSEGNIDIPWFVSNGYLVFTPDIYYSIAGKTGIVYGESVCNSVISAAKCLSKRPYVDAKKMAIQGHSFGGSETNYLITHSEIFAAAAEAAGGSDMISGYLTLIPLASSIEHFSKTNERGQTRMGVTLWQRPDLYLKSSSVLNADKVVTPLLIMHNKKDNQVQWRQGVEMYMALRRLGKRVWLLQYENGAHGVGDRDAIDYTIRLTQFFNHYLKNTPAPKWMVQGIPAEMKRVDSGYELEDSSKEP